MENQEPLKTCALVSLYEIKTENVSTLFPHLQVSLALICLPALYVYSMEFSILVSSKI